MYLNGKKVDKLPREAIEKMSANVSRAVSDYFALHPEEFDPWMESMGFKPIQENNTPTSEDGERARI